MKLPLAPPALETLLANPDLITGLLGHLSPTVDGHYLHWDELRHRQTPPGLRHEQWWLGIKIARNGLFKSLPLLDKQGRSFVFGLPEPVLRYLNQIDREAAGRIGVEAPIPAAERDRYILSSLIEEAITSSQLEGASTTRRVAEQMLREGRKPRDKSERMIFNNFLTMRQIRDVARAPLTPDVVMELHRLLTLDTLDDPADAGRLRPSDDIQIVDHRDNTVLHHPPHAAELPERLDRLCAFANASEDDEPFVHPVVRAILLHFMLAYDHPFVDGNGRTARALFYWSLARQGYWLMEFISISHILGQAPAQYARAYLYTETDGNDTTYFILHQLGVIRQAVAALHDYLGRQAEAQRNTERLLRSAPALRERLNHRQIALLTHALRHPGEHYTIEGHQNSHGVAYATARQDLLSLAGLALLERGKRGRGFAFYAPDDLRVRIGGLAQR